MTDGGLASLRLWSLALLTGSSGPSFGAVIWYQCGHNLLYNSLPNDLCLMPDFLMGVQHAKTKPALLGWDTYFWRQRVHGQTENWLFDNLWESMTGAGLGLDLSLMFTTFLLWLEIIPGQVRVANQQHKSCTRLHTEFNAMLDFCSSLLTMKIAQPVVAKDWSYVIVKFKWPDPDLC